MIDPETRDAIALMKSPAAQANPVKTATSMFTIALATLVWIGGRDEVIDFLEGVIVRVRDGHFAEPDRSLPHPNHPPGTA